MPYAAWIVVAIISHALSSLFPFLAAKVLRTQGAYGGSLMLYLFAALLLALGYLSNPSGRSLLAEGALLVRKSAHRRLVWIVIVGYTTVILFFYSGLKASELQPEQYGFVARLESVLPFLWGFLILKERATWMGILGSIIAFIGGGFVVYSSGLSLKAVWFGALFILVSSLTTTFVKKLLMASSQSPTESALSFFPVRMIGVLPGLGLFYLCSNDRITYDAEEWLNALFAGACIGSMFFLRFLSLAHLPMWLYATLGALQLVFTPLFGLLFGRPILEGLYVGASIIVLGEVIASIQGRRGERT